MQPLEAGRPARLVLACCSSLGCRAASSSVSTWMYAASWLAARSLPRDYSEECRFLHLPPDGDARDCAERAFAELVLRQFVWCLMGSMATRPQEMLGDRTHTSEPLLPSRRRKTDGPLSCEVVKACDGHESSLSLDFGQQNRQGVYLCE